MHAPLHNNNHTNTGLLAHKKDNKATGNHLKMSIAFSNEHQQFQNHHNHELSHVPFSELYKAKRALEVSNTPHHELSPIDETRPLEKL